MNILPILDEFAIAPQHVAAVELVPAYRAVMYFGSHGWKVRVILKHGDRVTLRSWGRGGDGPSATPQDERDEPEARALYDQILVWLRLYEPAIDAFGT